MIGKTVSHYCILEKIGSGGMGIVYKAKDTRLKRTVALKFLHPDFTRDPEAKQRFIHEAQAASALDHQNICTIHEIDETRPDPGVPEESRLFISMAYYEGETLKDKIQRGPLTISNALNYSLQVLQGLERAHQAGMIHRDIKSANIIITKHNEVRILDFGLAKLRGQTTVTKPGKTPGTVFYMSPEQIKGENIDQRTDLWSMGVMLYEMLTGEFPFKGDYEQAVLYSILNEEPKPIYEINKNVPFQLAKIVYRCLSKNLSKRYQSATELHSELEKLKQQIDAGEKVSVIPRSLQFKIFLKMRKFITAAVFVLSIIIISLLFHTQISNFLGFTGVPTEKNIAILPCTNIGNNPEYHAFLEGMVETLTSKLTQLEEYQGNINVVPFSEIRSQEIYSVEEAHKKFRINLAVTSSFQPFENNFRLILNLIDTKRLRQLQSTIIEEQLPNVIIIQDSILLSLTDMLELKLKPNKKKLLHAGNTQNSNAFDFYLKGRGFLQNYHNPESIDTAIVLFKKAISEDPAYPLAHASLGEAYWRKYRLTKDIQWIEMASNNCEKALNLNNRIPTVLISAGIIQREKGQYEKSLDFFQQALQIDPMNAYGLQGLAKTYESMGKDEEAEQSYKNAIIIRPNYWGNYNALGVFYYKQGSYEQAVTQFKKVVELTPQNIKGYTNLGGIYFYLEQWEDARKTFEKSLHIKPSYNAYHNLATLYFYEKRYGEAAQMYENAIKLSDKDYRVWGGLAESYYWTQNHKKAKEIYQKTIAIAEEKLQVNPLDEETLSYLAGYYAKLDDQKKARELLQKVIKTEPDDVNVIFRVAENYEFLGERKSALIWLEKALLKGYSISSIQVNPVMQKIKSDNRFNNLIKKYESRKKNTQN